MDRSTFLQRLPTACPQLATKARLQTDKVSGEPILLYPEGVVLLNGPSAAITRLCDGTHTFPQILAELAGLYQTTASELAGDVSDYIFKMHEQNLVVLHTEQEPEP